MSAPSSRDVIASGISDCALLISSTWGPHSCVAALATEARAACATREAEGRPGFCDLSSPAAWLMNAWIADPPVAFSNSATEPFFNLKAASDASSSLEGSFVLDLLSLSSTFATPFSERTGSIFASSAACICATHKRTSLIHERHKQHHNRPLKPGNSPGSRETGLVCQRLQFQTAMLYIHHSRLTSNLLHQ